jgi:DNA-binding NarL/FixJ family response regulator
MPPIRVVLATLPPLLGDIVRQLLTGHVDLEVIAEVASAGEMRDVLRRAGADVVVAGATSADGRVPPIDVLREHPGLRLIVIAGDARVAKVYELRPHETAIADISPSELLHVIRSTTTSDGRRFGEDDSPASIDGTGGCKPSRAPPINPKDDTDPGPQRRS